MYVYKNPHRQKQVFNLKFFFVIDQVRSFKFENDFWENFYDIDGPEVVIWSVVKCAINPIAELFW